MIYDSLAHIGSYRGLSRNFDRAIDVILNTDFTALPLERFEVDGDSVYYFIQDPAMREAKDSQFEAHERYADIQITVSGGEDMGYLPVEQIQKWNALDTEKDVRFSDVEEKGVRMPLNAGTFMILFPWDAHMPCLKNEHGKAKKVVFKVRM